LNVFEVPEASRIAKGRAIVNLLSLNPGERVVKLLCTRDMEGKYLVFLTKKGIIKRTEALAFSRIRSTGIRAITIQDDDQLIFCSVSTGKNSIVIATAKGQGIRFDENEVRSMGRQAAGVIGIRLKDDDWVVGMEVVTEDKDLLFATAHGYGKRVKVADFRIAHRGGYGVRTIPATKRNGNVIGLVIVTDYSNILLIDGAGKIIRLSSKEIRTMGRQAQGVRLVRLDPDQVLVAIVVAGEDTAISGNIPNTITDNNNEQ
ncbi:MAG TPA: DNA gyrase C-terminal beta-propeller domain-containing protein, partial [Candidatus Babeliaceae bacterium]|nr:DNA gyrase C-terminal beta-propeller domain-containing protein [Candidatus Babeliaceae bacterium]